MKKTKKAEAGPVISDELSVDYRFDYQEARPNRFAHRVSPDSLVVTLDPDVSKVFTSADSVNNILRALIASMPKTS